MGSPYRGIIIGKSKDAEGNAGTETRCAFLFNVKPKTFNSTPAEMHAASTWVAGTGVIVGNKSMCENGLLLMFEQH